MLIRDEIHNKIDTLPTEVLGNLLDYLKTFETKNTGNSKNKKPTLDEIHNITSKIKSNWSTEISQDREDRF
ncbi:MAG: hypothetical protein ACLFQJ_10555 [Campylobacterales bacterium]